MRLVVVGLIIGFIGAVMLGRVIHSLLFQVSPADPATYMTVTLVLPAAALMGCWIRHEKRRQSTQW